MDRMKPRPVPESVDPLLVRICVALDITPRALAIKLGIEYEILQPYFAQKSSSIESDETWLKVNDYVNTQMGFIMAARLDLNRALQKGREERVERLARLKRLQPKPSPRS